jgi:RimJ/RimL family protein N-acetyltransferase
MMEHLGGPESGDALDRRHERYLDIARGAMFVLEFGTARQAAGSIGYWESTVRGKAAYETGWMVFREFGRRGIATAALSMLIEKVRSTVGHRFLHAFPNVANVASNALCRKAGFEFLKAIDFEYPKGSTMRCNDWRFDLRPGDPG